MNNNLAAIMERCENLSKNPNPMFSTGEKYYLEDVPNLLSEIDRLTAELDVAKREIESVSRARDAHYEEWKVMQSELAASQRREQAAVELLVKSGFCSQQPLYECDEERPAACYACITKWCLCGLEKEGGE